MLRSIFSKPRVSIIVPVYGDWGSLLECINALREYAPLSSEIVLVNDCGPDAEGMHSNISKVIKNDKRFKLYKNEENMGFVKTCNLAIKYTRRNDNILLLNSDAEITEGAVEEMVNVLNRADNIASVSPRSNNATVFSIPFNPETGEVSPPGVSYDIYQKVKEELPDVYETPTTHGFCMLIRRSVIDEIGLFDEAFGMGYGEENDFCMRARKSGYTHAIANKAYVFHEGSKSFSKESRDKRADDNAVVLNERHPEYKELVNQYILHAVIPEQELITKIVKG